MRSVAILLLGIPLAFAGTHCLKYFYTVASGDIDIPEVTVVGMVDDQQFMYFDSDAMKTEPKTDWIRADHWDRQTQIDIRHYYEYRTNMQMIKDVFNQSMSDGVHTLQVMYGCEIRDDGTSRGFNEFGYDGEDIITFDKNTLTYTAANRQADITKSKMDSDKSKAKHCKAYLENTCIDRLKKYMSYKDTLKRKVAPEVSLLQKDSSSQVICHATGFYPSNIIMTWEKNQEELHEDVEVSETLPNADGTFQKSISLSVKSEEWKKNPDVYRCVIQHVATEQEIVASPMKSTIRSNELHASVIIAIISGCVLAFIVIVVIMGIVWRKYRQAISPNSTGYVIGNTTDAD